MPAHGRLSRAACPGYRSSILAAAVAEVDVTEWLLYANPAIYAGRGLAQGEGRVFTREGRLVASYTVQAMIRDFRTPPGAMGKDSTPAMWDPSKH